MTTKLKIVNKLVEILPTDDTTTYPRLNFNLQNNIYAVPISTENPNDNSIASSFKIDNSTFYIPKKVKKTIILTNNYYKMSDLYPSKYQTMVTVPDELDTSNVTNMSSMFNNCTSLTSIPQLDTNSVTSMAYMFNGCTSLTTIPQLDTSNVGEMSYMFRGCTNLPLTFPWVIDCSNIPSASRLICMFQNTSVTSVTFANVRSNVRSLCYSSRLKGDNTLTINFV